MTSDLDFFLDRIQNEMPARVHSRDTDNGGAPQWHKSFEQWLCDGEAGRFSEFYREDQELCQFHTRECQACDGSGIRIRHRWIFRHPAKRALHRLSQQPVPKGRPRLDSVLWAIASNDGDLALALAALRQEHSYMWSSRAMGWMAHALWEFRRTYCEDAPVRVIRDKSEAQSIAEAAA